MLLLDSEALKSGGCGEVAGNGDEADRGSAGIGGGASCLAREWT